MQDVEYKKIIDKIWKKREALGLKASDVNNPKNWCVSLCSKIPK